MLRSLKAKVSGKKQQAKDDPPGQPSVSSGKSVVAASASSKPAAAPAKPAAPAGKEKPPLPVISEESLQQAYAHPLPSFREVPPSGNENGGVLRAGGAGRAAIGGVSLRARVCAMCSARRRRRR